MRMLFDPKRRFHITLSRKKMYDPVEFYLAHNIFQWNKGTSIDLLSAAGQKYLNMVATRAIAAAKGKPESIRSHYNRANKAVREGIRALAMDADPTAPSIASAPASARAPALALPLHPAWT